MHKFKFLSMLILAIMMAWSMNGLAGQFGEYKPQGFLSDYSKLQPEGGDSDAFMYINSAIDRSKYKKVMVDRIKIYLKEDAESKEIDPAELKELVDYFHHGIVKAIDKDYPVVQQAGPDVLRLRIAITDLVPNKPKTSVVTLAVPFLWVAEAGAGAAEGDTGSTPFVGEASIELETMDSQSSQQVGAFIETKPAKKYEWNKGVKTGVKSYAQAYSTWSYTKKAIDDWVKMIRHRLDIAHSK